MQIIKPANHFPAPWDLQGEGIIMVFNFKKDWVENNAFLNADQKGKFLGGLGYVMLVNYHQSPVGPYKELLIIPGKFSPHNRQSITKIFVDSDSSTQNGRFNWGIPKETVPMIWRSEKNWDTIGIGQEDDPILFCKIKTYGIPFPATTKLVPIKLYQELSGQIFLTNPQGSGWGKLAKVESLRVNKDFFPNISEQKPLFCFKVNSFHMHFPESIIKYVVR
ncbi:hypothetical protein [Cecembia rubra]|uniref:Acetoacetate decarboxylase n=1 Tax=Cecembia rubra TaxID=1485585 RepID=A0A2P8DXY1_9BACT|nr:hypothetical protein [Cecembia rubra]PSL02017.1 hypothetical protein CLV48_111106 [Cecembia rubra]